MTNETKTHPMQDKYCMIRTFSAGVHFGTVSYISDVTSKEILLTNCKRLYKWEGALSLSEVSTTGINPKGTIISAKVPEIYLTEVIEIIPISDEANKTFEQVPPYQI